MSVQSLLTKSATFAYRVPVGSDEYGQPVFDFVLTEVQCYYRFLKSASGSEGGYIETADVEMFLHAGTQTADLDTVTLEGHEFIPFGVAENAINARTGGVSHVVLHLRRGDS